MGKGVANEEEEPEDEDGNGFLPLNFPDEIPNNPAMNKPITNNSITNNPTTSLSQP